jgi:hypothetical protein
LKQLSSFGSADHAAINAAPFDAFPSADRGCPQRLMDTGLAQGLKISGTQTPIVYPKGTLVLWFRRISLWHRSTSADNSAKTTVLEFEIKAQRGNFHLEMRCNLASKWTVIFDRLNIWLNANSVQTVIATQTPPTPMPPTRTWLC